MRNSPTYPEYRKKEELLPLIAQDGLELRKASTVLRDIVYVVRIAVSQNGLALEHAEPTPLNNKETCFIAVSQNGLALEFIKHPLNLDEDILEAALRQNFKAWKFVPERAKTQRSFVLRLARIHWEILLELDEKFRQDSEILLAAIETNPEALSMAPADFSLTSATLMIALEKGAGREILARYKGDWKSDPEIVELLIKKNLLFYSEASPELQQKAAFALDSVKKNANVFLVLPRRFQLNERFAGAALEGNPWLLEHMPKKIQDLKILVLLAVKKEGCVLQFASKRLRADREVVLAAVQQNGVALEFAAKKWQRDTEICLAAVRTDIEARRYIHGKIRKAVMETLFPKGELADCIAEEASV